MITTFIICGLVIIIILLAVALYISNNTFDGTLSVGSNEYGSTISLNIAPSDLVDKDQVRFKIISPPVVPPSPPETA